MPSLRHDEINLRPSKQLARQLELVEQHPSYQKVIETHPVRSGKWEWLPRYSPHPDTKNFPNHVLTVQGKAQGDDDNYYLVRAFEILPGPPTQGAQVIIPRRIPEKFITAASTSITRTKVATGTAPDAVTTPGARSAVTHVEGSSVANKETALETLATGNTQGKKLVSDFGGVVADVEESIVDEDAQADSGFGVLESSVESLGPGGGGVKRTVSVDEFPIVSGGQIDSRYGVVFNYNRQIVDPTTAGSAGIVQAGSSVFSVELEPKDQWHSWKTSSSTVLPENQVWYGLKRENSLPDVLTGLSVVGTERWEPVPTWKQMPKTPLRARFTRSFSFGPPEDPPDPPYYGEQPFHFRYEYDRTSVSHSVSAGSSTNVSTNSGTNEGTNTSNSSSEFSGTNEGTNESTNEGTSEGTSESTNESTSEGTSEGTSESTNESINEGTSESTSISTNDGTSSSHNTSNFSGSNTTNYTTTSSGAQRSSSISSDQTATSDRGTPTTADPKTYRASSGSSTNTYTNTGGGTNTSNSTGTNTTDSAGTNSSTNSGTQSGTSSSTNTSTSSGTHSGTSSSTNTSTSSGTHSGTSSSTNNGTTSSTHSGTSQSETTTTTTSQNTGTNEGTSTHTSDTTTTSEGKSIFVLNLPQCIRAQMTVALPDSSNFEIPATSESDLPWGEYVEVSRNSDHWKNGIWVTEKTEVLLPS